MSWPTVALAEVSDFITDGTHASPERTEVGVPVLSAQNVNDNRLSYETSRYTSEQEYAAFRKRVDLQQNDMLLTIVGSIGRPALVDEVRPAVFQRSVGIIRPSAHLFPKFLLHAANQPQFQAQLIKFSNQSAQAGIYLGKLKGVEIPLPPLEEQRRIAAILDKADALRQKRKRALALLDQFRRSSLLSNWTNNSQTQLLGESLNFVTSGGRGWAKYYSASGERFIRSLDVRRDSISDEVPTFVDPPDSAEARRTRVEAGDVLLTITGSRIGRAATVPPKLAGSYISQHVAILRLRPDGVSAGFLSWYLNSAGGQRQIAKWQYGQTKPGLNFEQIRSFEIPVLSANAQSACDRALRQADAAISSGARQLETVESLFASLQSRAFTGQI